MKRRSSRMSTLSKGAEEEVPEQVREPEEEETVSSRRSSTEAGSSDYETAEEQMQVEESEEVAAGPVEEGNTDSEEVEWEIEAIVDERMNKMGGFKEYNVKWEGWPSSTNTWEPEEAFARNGMKILKAWKRKVARKSKSNKPNGKKRSAARQSTGKQKLTPQKAAVAVENISTPKGLRDQFQGLTQGVFDKIDALTDQVESKEAESKALQRKLAKGRAEVEKLKKELAEVNQKNWELVKENERLKDQAKNLDLFKVYKTKPEKRVEELEMQRGEAAKKFDELQANVREKLELVNKLELERNEAVAANAMHSERLVKISEIVAIILGEPVSEDQIPEKVQLAAEAYKTLKRKGEIVDMILKEGQQLVKG